MALKNKKHENEKHVCLPFLTKYGKLHFFSLNNFICSNINYVFTPRSSHLEDAAFSEI